MRFDLQGTKRLAQHHSVIFLLLWWGGLNCLAGCITAPNSAIGESHCSMRDAGDDCCQKTAGGEESGLSRSIGALSTSLPHPKCCTLESLSAEVSHNVRITNVLVPSAILGRLEFISESKPRTQLPDQLVCLPDRGGTYLFHCIFLI